MSNRHAPIRSLSLLVSIGLVLGLAGCDVEDGVDDQELLDPELAELDAETVEIIENLQLAGYPRAEIEVDDDENVIVGGDAVVSLEASREMIGSDDDEHDDHDHEQSFRQYRTNNLVDSSVQIICLDGDALVPHLNLYVGMQGAIAKYNQLDLSFRFYQYYGFPPAPNGDDCDAIITFTTQAGTSSQAGFPSGGQPYDTIIMGTGTADYGVNVSRHVIMHEIGHTLGLRHTDYFNRSYSCGTGGNEGSAGVGAVHIPGTTPGYDTDSVMNSCYSPSSTGVFSIWDKLALWTIY